MIKKIVSKKYRCRVIKSNYLTIKKHEMTTLITGENDLLITILPESFLITNSK